MCMCVCPSRDFLRHSGSGGRREMDRRPATTPLARMAGLRFPVRARGTQSPGKGGVDRDDDGAADVRK